MPYRRSRGYERTLRFEMEGLGRQLADELADEAALRNHFEAR
jgi:hypothetical protein